VDPHTALTRQWLDERFRTKTPDGSYNAHQPIHGFESARRAGLLRDYVRIYRVLRALAGLSFRSLLEVGAAEGLIAALAARLLAADVRVSDLSEEACRRASEIFGLEARQADVHALPHADESADVVVASEVLEHVTDPERATRELLRVARYAVVLTVPHEPRERQEPAGTSSPHAHLHFFEEGSFDAAALGCERVVVERILSAPLRWPLALLEARPLSRAPATLFGRKLAPVYELLRPVLQRVPGRAMTRVGVRLDDFCCRQLPGYDGVLAVLLKKPGCLRQPAARISAGDLLGFSVPPHEVGRDSPGGVSSL
jgi:SAM-dependent methyltransferase